MEGNRLGLADPGDGGPVPQRVDSLSLFYMLDVVICLVTRIAMNVFDGILELIYRVKWSLYYNLLNYVRVVILCVYALTIPRTVKCDAIDAYVLHFKLHADN